MTDTAVNPFGVVASARARLALKVCDLLDKELSAEVSDGLSEEEATVILKLSQAFVTLTNVHQQQKKFS